MDEDKKFEELQAELRTRFELLPEDLQNVIQSSDYQNKLFEIAKKNKWTYEQLNLLEMETTMVLLGMVNPDSYQQELATQLGKKPADLTAVIAEIKNQIFDPIRSSLMKLYTAVPLAETEPVTEPTEVNAADSAVLEKSGITVEESRPAIPAQTAPENRGTILSGIENPPKTAPRVLNQVPVSSVPKAPYAAKVSGNGMVAGKLSETVAIPPKATDYSIPKMGTNPTPTPPPKAPGADPYKEPLE